jgi:hypothetical protein
MKTSANTAEDRQRQAEARQSVDIDVDKGTEGRKRHTATDTRPSCGCNAQKKEACSNLLLARAGGTTLAVPPHGVYEHAARRLAAPEPWRWSRCGRQP